MMRFILSLALAVCSVVNAGEVPYVSGLVDFAPMSNNGSLPFYWNLGQGEGLLVGGGDYIDVQQDGWRIEVYDTTGQTSWAAFRCTGCKAESKSAAARGHAVRCERC